MTTPVQAYYAPLHGAWTCPFEFVLDEDALRAAPMHAFDKLRLRMTVWTAKLFGPLRMDTTLDYRTSGDQGVMLHTTRVSKWGFPLMLSRESITMDADGRRFVMRGGLRMIPSYWNIRDFGEGQGVVDETATRATYTFDWLGVTMRQETVSTIDTVTITQTTSFSRGVQRLSRS